MSKIICGVDLETTGLDAQKDQITEIGAILWDTETNQPVGFFNKFIKIEGKVPPEIVKLTGITDSLLEKFGEDLSNVLREFDEFSNDAEIFMAHNAPFDKGFLKVPMSKHIDPSWSDDNFTKWIDSSVDIDFPENIGTRKLSYLASEHGFVNPFAHRALSDVLTMFQIAKQYDWDTIIKNANTPSITLKAFVTFEQNQKAKNAGFRWDGTRKIWIKNVKEHRVDTEIEKCKELGFVAKRV